MAARGNVRPPVLSDDRLLIEPPGRAVRLYGVSVVALAGCVSGPATTSTPNCSRTSLASVATCAGRSIADRYHHSCHPRAAAGSDIPAATATSMAPLRDEVPSLR